MLGRSTNWKLASWTLYAAFACVIGTFVGCASTAKSPKPTPPTSAAVGNNTTIVAIAPAPSASNCSLPEFLGLPGLAKGTGGILQRLGSRLLSGLDLTGRFPGLQPQPPVLPITDPANMEEGAPPAVQAAAEIKQEEDAAPQKIMAIRYLATLGCGGCYEKVEDALLEGMSDCTEEVRFEAVKALQCKPECGCKFCSSPSCCSAKVRKRLLELTTCEKEPSARIRRVARMALACCNSKPLEEEDIPREGPPAPTGDLAFTTNSLPPTFFDGIQLVSFENASTPSQAGDMILARVNGEPVFESQVLPLVEARLRSGDALNANDPTVRRKQLTVETTRVIDWKLIGQQTRNEVRVAGAGMATPTPSPQEIQAWFERRIQIAPDISSQELLAYYEVNRERYRVPLKLRWEQVSVLVNQCSNRESANRIAAYLRNRALGVPIEPPTDFSKDKIETEIHPWSEITSVDPAPLRSALRNLQPGQVSQAIDVHGNLHLLRVLERQEEGYLPLPIVVDRIRIELLRERKRTAELRLIGQLRSQSQIWTVFDATIQSNDNNSTSQNVIPASIQWQRN